MTKATKLPPTQQAALERRGEGQVDWKDETLTKTAAKTKRKTLLVALVDNYTHSVLFGAGLCLVIFASFELLMNHNTNPIARWRWLYRDLPMALGLGEFGGQYIALVIGSICMAWALLAVVAKSEK